MTKTIASSDYVACSEFVKRQTPESGFSHFNRSWTDLAALVKSAARDPNNITQGYKDGVILVRVPASGIHDSIGSFKFYSGIVKLNQRTKLDACYAPRVLGEAPCIRLGAYAKKQVASSVQIVCYSSEVLDEDNDRSTDADWEIICIKANTSNEEDPMEPYTMARNFLHMKGGTKAEFTAEQFAKSIVYWNNHAMCIGKHSWWDKVKKFFIGN